MPGLTQVRNFVPSTLGLDVAAFGAVADCKSVSDGAITIGTAILTSATANFQVSDIGKTVQVAGAGVIPSSYVANATLVTTILSRQSSTQVTLNTNASTSVTNALVDWGTDNTSFINNAIILANSFINGNTVNIGPGKYLVASAVADQNQSIMINILSNVIIRGAGRGITIIRAGLASGNVLWADNKTNFQIHDITVDATNGGNCDCFKLDVGCSHYVLNNCEGIGSSGGFELQGGVTDIQVSNCYARDATQFPFAGNDGWGFKVAEHYSPLFPFTGVARVQLSNCIAYNCAGEGFVIQGEDDTGSTGLIYRAEGIQLNNCYALSCGTSVSTKGFGFLIWLANAQLTNCNAFGCWYGIEVRQCSGVALTTCRAKNSSEGGIRVLGSTDNSFTGCVSNDNGQNIQGGDVIDGFAVSDYSTTPSSRNVFLGCIAGNTLGNTTQQYGWRNSTTHGGTGNVVLGCDFNSNATAPSLGATGDSIVASLSPIVTDSVNNRVGIKTASPQYPLDITDSVGDGSGDGSFIRGITRLRTKNLTDYALSTTGLSAAATAWAIKANGLMEWGDGTNSRDTFLQRIGASILGTNSATAFQIGGSVGFYNTSPQAKQTITGSRGGNAALASLLTALATLGLITDSTTA